MIDLEALTTPTLSKFEDRYVFSLALFKSNSDTEQCVFGTLPIEQTEAPEELEQIESSQLDDWENRNWGFYISDHEDSDDESGSIQN
jgi:hypothetical protein